MSKRIKKLLCIIMLIVFAGCSGKEIRTLGFKEVDAPDWVIKGSGLRKETEKNIFYGVGSASGIKNYSLLKSTSDDRARNEIAKVFEVYISSLMRDYMASTIAGEMNKSSEEQHVEQAVKTVVSVTLRGIEIVDYWEHPNKETVFSLAKLDLNKFQENIQNANELNSKVRDFIKDNAKKLHDDLSKEEEKVRNK